MSDREFDLEKTLKKIRQSWIEVMEHFGIVKDMDVIVKVKGWDDIKIKIEAEEEKLKEFESRNGILTKRTREELRPKY